MQQAALLLSLFFATAFPAFAILADWYPAKKPYPHGKLGTGVYSLVWNLPRYKTAPNRPYIILGKIHAGGGLGGSPRTRAVEIAREHGADAILWAHADEHDDGPVRFDTHPVIGLFLHCDYLAIRWARKEERSGGGCRVGAP